MQPTTAPLLSIRGITRSFGAVRALDGVDLDLAAGEIHAILGENGAGKSTLMHVLDGVYAADGGEVWIAGERVRFGSPRQARQAGVGMVHQHFALIDALSVTENLALSFGATGLVRLDRGRIMRQAQAVAARAGLELPPANALLRDLPVGARQRLEIVKALASARRVLILDEPTAVLTPPEVQQLFHMLRQLRAQGLLILFITHKLPEVVDVADRVSIMRRGKVIATHVVRDTDINRLAEEMVGHMEPALAQVSRPVDTTVAALQVTSVSLRDRRGVVVLDNVSLGVHPGEIFGIAGVDGNGQRELFEILAGLVAPQTGTLNVYGAPLRTASTQAAIAAGIGVIPPDRRREGLVLDMSVIENLLLHRRTLDRLSRGGFVDRRAARAYAQAAVQRFRINCASLETPVRELSGGNQQRVIIARELAEQPAVLVTVNPTRGLDLAASRAVADALRAAVEEPHAEEGQRRRSAVVLISTDLDEIIDLSDRVAVLYRGRLSPPLPRSADRERLGMLMAGVAAASMSAA